MDDRTAIAVGIGIGAVVGGFVGFLLFTERGRSFRRDLEPQLDSLLGEAQRLSVAFDRTRRAVKDGLATLAPDEAPSGAGRADWSH